jgi:hypothetical protein
MSRKEKEQEETKGFFCNNSFFVKEGRKEGLSF